jgi:putative ABC transport system permease protein
MIVLSHGLWARRFRSDTSVIGSSVPIAGGTATVVGVMPRSFRPLLSEEFWDVYTEGPNAFPSRGRWAMAVGRLKDGVSAGQAKAELETIYAQLVTERPERNTGWSATVVPLSEQVVGGARRALLVLLGAVTFVLLIAVANVANLLLARSAARQRELAVRTAMGASTSRLMRLWLTETLVLAVAGGAAGITLAVWGLELLRSLAPADLPRLDEVSLDRGVLVFTACSAMLTALVLGLVTAVNASWRAPLGALKGEDLRVTAGRRTSRFRSALVVAQVALAMVLLMGAGLLTRSLATLYGVDLGFDPRNVTTAQITLPTQVFESADRVNVFYRDLLSRVRALPGVNSAGLTRIVPMGPGGAATGWRAMDRPAPEPGSEPGGDIRSAEPGYFATMDIPLLRGRMFDGSEIDTLVHQIIINEALANELWPGQDPIGKVMRVAWWRPDADATVIGVVGNTRAHSPDVEPRPMLYYSLEQSPHNDLTIVIRSNQPADAVVRALTGLVSAMNRNVPVDQVASMEDRIDTAVGGRRYPMVLLGIFAALAMVLAAIGLYGVLAYGVNLRTREIGVRIALGALPRSVVKAVVGGGLGLVGIGIAIGVAGAVLTTRVLANLLYGIEPTDPVTFVLVAALLLFVALLASWLPARRAARVHPMTALRSE